MNKQSSLQKTPIIVTVTDNRPFGQVFLMKKDGILTPEPGMPEGKEPLVAALSEEEIRKLVLTNRAILFGEKTVGLSVKIDNFGMGWDALLFDFSDREDPRGYLLKATKDIVPSMQSMIAMNSFLDDPAKRTPLIETVKTDIEKDKKKLKIFQQFVVEGYALEDMLNHVLRRYLRGLFLINEDDSESVKVYEGYAGARAENLCIMYFRKYVVGKKKMLSVFPELSEMRRRKVAVEVVKKKEKVIHTEDHHFAKGSRIVQAIYEKLKSQACKIYPRMLFNPSGDHYIAMKKDGGKNLAFFHFRKSSLYLVVKQDEKIVRKMVKKAVVKTLPPTVQKFWNGTSTGLVITDLNQAGEIVNILKKLIKG